MASSIQMAASISSSSPLHPLLSKPTCRRNRAYGFRQFAKALSLRFYGNRENRCAVAALKTEPDGSSLLRKPVVPSNSAGTKEVVEEVEQENVEEDKEEEMWTNWEDRILEDTVPLVNFARMILHSGMYHHGDRLRADHERTIVEKLLPYHPESQKKIGSGIDYITIGFHPDFNSSRCLFVVQKDGKSVDFSYWKCIKGFIRKNYPLVADSFILRHFGTRAALRA